MSETNVGFPRRYRESLFGAVSAGFVFLLVGAIFIMTPNLFNKTLDFFSNFDFAKRVPNTVIYLPAPDNPSIHQVVYLAAEQFSYALGFFQLVILALRVVYGSPWSKRAETASNFVFWIGAGYVIRTLLIEITTWFVFWSAIIMLIGGSLIIRAIILAVGAPFKRRTI